MKIKKRLFLFFELLLFANFGIKICNNNILKIITASNFKLGQLIEDDQYFKKSYFIFFELLLFANLAIENL